MFKVDKSILNLLLINFLLKTNAQKKLVNIKIEKYNFCPNLQTVIRYSPKTTIQIAHNGLNFYGSVNITDVVSKPISLQARIMKCETPNNCVEEYYFTLPGLCGFIDNVPLLGKGLGDFCIPKVRCPIKKVKVTFNITIPDTKLSLLPVGTALRKVKILMIEELSSNKKRVLECLSALIRTYSYSNRKNNKSFK